MEPERRDTTPPIRSRRRSQRGVMLVLGLFLLGALFVWSLFQARANIPRPTTTTAPLGA